MGVVFIYCDDKLCMFRVALSEGLPWPQVWFFGCYWRLWRPLPFNSQVPKRLASVDGSPQLFSKKLATGYVGGSSSCCGNSTHQDLFVDKQVSGVDDIALLPQRLRKTTASNMIVPLLVTASVATFAVKQFRGKTSKPSEAKPLENGEGSLLEHDRLKASIEEEEEEVKLISSIFDKAHRKPSTEDESLLPEFQDPLSLEIKAETDKIYEADDASETERLCNIIKELEEKEVKLEGELLEYYRLKEQESDVLELHRQLKTKKVEINQIKDKINSLHAERKNLRVEAARGDSARKELEVVQNRTKEIGKQIQLDMSQTKGHLLLLKQQVSGLQVKEEEAVKKDVEADKKPKDVKELEMEVMELKRQNKELQHEKRELAVKSEMVANSQQHFDDLRHTNESLLKQLEGLQMNRFNEVDELVYLRWVNACLRHELRNYKTPSGKIMARDLSKSLSPKSQEKAKQLMLEYAGLEHGQGDADLHGNSQHPSSPGSEDFDVASNESSNSKNSNLSKKPSLIQKLKKLGKSKDDASAAASSPSGPFSGSFPRRMSSILRRRGSTGDLTRAAENGAISTVGNREQDPDSPRTNAEPVNSVASSFNLMSRTVEGARDEKYANYKERHKLATEREKLIKEKAEKARAANFEPMSITMTKLAEIEKRPPRVPRPPPKSFVGAPISADTDGSTGLSSGSPPPLPGVAGSSDKVHQAPELVELYQTLMKRDTKKDTSSNVSDARSNPIGEIENQSFLLAVKADVETQGDFVQSLAAEVRAASFTNVDDLVAFVNWLDEELSFLVDERAVLKHFDWPEGKVDALREAAFEYQDLTKLEKQISSFSDDPSQPCEAALENMYGLLEKVENSVYALLRTRDLAMSRYREFGIPVDWITDLGVVGKIKLASVQLAQVYMKHVTYELDSLSGPEKEPNREFLMLQGIRFAFRVHQFAGGFDAESMKAFEELRRQVHSETGEDDRPDAA